MARLSPKQIALISVSLLDLARQGARAYAAREERKRSRLERMRASVENRYSRRREKQRHHVRNLVLAVSGAVAAMAVALELVGRRRSGGASPLLQAGAAAQETLESDGDAGATDVLAAGAAAAKSVASAVGDDVSVGARTAKDAASDAAKDHVVQPVKRKLVRLAVLGAAALTVYVLAMAAVIAVLVDRIT